MIRLLFEYFSGSFRRDESSARLKVLIASIALVCYGATGFMYFEIQDKPDLTWPDAFWWAIVTMTTVGYGDLFPTTNWGRYAVGIPLMIFGVAILGYLLSILATGFIEAQSKAQHGMKKISSRNHILIIHYPSEERLVTLVSELREDAATRKKPIVLIDNSLEKLPVKLDNLNVQFVRGNPTREATLLQANIHEASHAIVLSQSPRDPRSDDLNLAVTMSIEAMRPEIHSVAECIDPESIEVLRRTGCDAVVCVSRFSTSMLIQELLDPGVQEVVEELTSVRVGQQIFVVPITAMKTWLFSELQSWASDQGMLLIGVKKDLDLSINPSDDIPLSPEHKAVFIGAKRPGSIDTSRR